MPSPFRTFLRKRLGQSVVTCGKSGVIGGGAAVKGLSKGLHALGNSEIADAHFPQVGVHIRAEPIKKGLRSMSPHFGADRNRHRTIHKCSSKGRNGH